MRLYPLELVAVLFLAHALVDLVAVLLRDAACLLHVGVVSVRRRRALQDLSSQTRKLFARPHPNKRQIIKYPVGFYYKVDSTAAGARTFSSSSGYLVILCIGFIR